ncbi:hypothetical protein V5E97_06590 [Singulisphaera sp. Ch08]|uniref:Uncharacterized protein n=1 Tax=Singulisphaera sp. Ch08 TaxID=3120278 RepID=A0AAU7CKK9_9BACT
MTVDLMPCWLADALRRIDALPCKSIRDVDRKRFAARLVRFAEIDDPAFPCPAVWRDEAGAIVIRWDCPHGGAKILEILITHPRFFQVSFWTPGKTTAVRIVKGKHAQWVRRILEDFWGVPTGCSVEALMELAEIGH